MEVLIRHGGTTVPQLPLRNVYYNRRMFPILLTVFAVSPALYLIFSKPSLNPSYFFIGCGMSLLIEVILLAAYCIFKLQQTFRKAHGISIKRNSELTFGAAYQFEKLASRDELFCNKYIEVPKALDKHNAIKFDTLYYNYEEAQVDQEPRRKIMGFLNLIRGYHSILSQFNNCLVSFGKSFIALGNNGIISLKKYVFAEFEQALPSEISEEELSDHQRKILHRIKQEYKARKEKENSKKLLFPTWSTVIQSMKVIGDEFEKIEMIRQANSSMINMIHQKVLEDYEKIEEKIRNLASNMEELVEKTHSLKKDYKEYKIEEVNEMLREKEPHNEMKFWLRKKIYEFKDLERKITENERSFKVQREELSSYKATLASFTDENKEKYEKIIRHHFIAFLDSYYITVEECVQQLEGIIYHQVPALPPLKPPKVSKWRNFKNMNQALEFEKVYQGEYLRRVEFYSEKLQGLMESLPSLACFLEQVHGIFQQQKSTLEHLERENDLSLERENSDRERKLPKEYLMNSRRYFKNFLRYLSGKNLELSIQVSKLLEANGKVKDWNEPHLRKLSGSIARKVEEAKAILRGIKLEEGPVLYKYSSSKSKLEVLYKEMEESIKQVKEFEEQYLTHSSRVKKILIFSLLGFFAEQKNILRKWIDKKIPPEYEKEPNDEENLENSVAKVSESDEHHEPNSILEPKSQSLHTGFGLSKQHVHLINRFLFVAFIEWKNSKFFKEMLTEELMILFNNEPIENFSAIFLSKMEFSGAPPEIVWVRELKSEADEAFLDIYLAFKGKWEFKINTEMVLFGRLSVEVKIEVEEFYCVMRLCFVPSWVGSGWFSFIGEPISKFKVIPSIGAYTLEMEPVKNMFHNLIMGKLKKLTYPTREKIPVPLSKKDLEGETIKKKLQELRPKLGANFAE